MGESGQVVITPAFSNGTPKTAFEERGLNFDKSTEVSAPSYYSAILEDQNHNSIKAEMSSSRLYRWIRPILVSYFIDRSLKSGPLTVHL